ncbi:MAG: FMN-binding negative transcriptional regulator [Acidimicrobiales bacterium]
MYVPPLFALDDIDAWRVVDDAGAGMLVIQSESGLASVYVPVIVGEDRRIIRTHVARANPWWKSVGEGAEVLALFLAASAYVTPSHYPSRLENPGVVPTWNYVAAEVRGRATIHDDLEWKLAQTSAVTSHFERGRDPEWRADDLDSHFREQQLKAIVGVELEVISIEGKAKLSQNRPDVDRRSVRDHFVEGSLMERNVAKRMSAD